MEHGPAQGPAPGWYPDTDQPPLVQLQTRAAGLHRSQRAWMPWLRAAWWCAALPIALACWGATMEAKAVRIGAYSAAGIVALCGLAWISDISEEPQSIQAAAGGADAALGLLGTPDPSDDVDSPDGVGSTIDQPAGDDQPAPTTPPSAPEETTVPRPETTTARADQTANGVDEADASQAAQPGKAASPTTEAAATTAATTPSTATSTTVPSTTANPTTVPPVTSAPTSAPSTSAPTTSQPPPAQDCHPAYSPCIPNFPGDALNCGDLPGRLKPVTVHNVANDPYGLDGDNDGVGCESG